MPHTVVFTEILARREIETKPVIRSEITWNINIPTIASSVVCSGAVSPFLLFNRPMKAVGAINLSSSVWHGLVNISFKQFSPHGFSCSTDLDDFQAQVCFLAK